MENVKIVHPFHEHPLILIKNVDNESLDCYGCGKGVSKLDWVYVCEVEKSCSSKSIFHRRCGDVATQIRHHSHPQHLLHLHDFRMWSRWWSHRCNICGHKFGNELGYRCFSCDLVLDTSCKKLEFVGGEVRELQHPSHSIHPLMLMKKPPFVFLCDACGEEDRDMAYVCAMCNFMIHEACAALPLSLPSCIHDHPLTLSFRFIFEYHKYRLRCDVCYRDFDMACWVYNCGVCRFFAHIRCATLFLADFRNQERNEDGSILCQFPLEACSISKELITPFVLREVGLDKIPDVKYMPTSINMPETTVNYLFLSDYHKQLPLSLVSETELSSSHKDQVRTKINAAADDEEEEEICDVCVTPTSSFPPYYECIANFSVHYVCNLLPKTLSPLECQLYGDCSSAGYKNHRFICYTSSERYNKIDFCKYCSLCGSFTNGMVYECEACRMMIDLKCASLPTTIKHASHPQHKLIKTRAGSMIVESCYACGDVDLMLAYCCTGSTAKDGCYYALCLKCVQFPKSITKQEWDKHPLLLTYDDASIDHPTDFYCQICEEQMNPKKWMYHCRTCDNSFHISCLRTASGNFRNMKLGCRFEFGGRLHRHPLTFTYITFKNSCDICHWCVYTRCAFECADCNYVVCLSCGESSWLTRV